MYIPLRLPFRKKIVRTLLKSGIGRRFLKYISYISFIIFFLFPLLSVLTNSAFVTISLFLFLYLVNDIETAYYYEDEFKDYRSKSNR